MLKINGSITDKKEILKDRHWKPYEQRFIVYAMLIEEDFELDTPTGTVEGKKGDYVVMGPQGNKWVMPKVLFEKAYESI